MFTLIIVIAIAMTIHTVAIAQMKDDHGISKKDKTVIEAIKKRKVEMK